MGHSFRRRGDAIVASFLPPELELLRAARDQLRASLEHPDPDDPVIARLFPSTVLGDEQADRELRGLVHDDLRGVRLAGLEELVAILDRARSSRGRFRVELVDDEPALLLGVLNDLRLAIGARLGIEELDHEQVDPDGPVGYRLAVMEHLAWWQEQLLAILDPEAVTWATAVRAEDLEPDPLDPDDLTAPDHDDPGGR